MLRRMLIITGTLLGGLLNFSKLTLAEPSRTLVISDELAKNLVSHITWKQGETSKTGDVTRYELKELSSEKEVICELSDKKNSCTIFHSPTLVENDRIAEIDVSHFYGEDKGNLWHRLAKTKPTDYSGFNYGKIVGVAHGHFYATISFTLR